MLSEHGIVRYTNSEVAYTCQVEGRNIKVRLPIYAALQVSGDQSANASLLEPEKVRRSRGQFLMKTIYLDLLVNVLFGTNEHAFVAETRKILRVYDRMIHLKLDIEMGMLNLSDFSE